MHSCRAVPCRTHWQFDDRFLQFDMVVLLALLLTIAVAALVLWIIDGDADITLLFLSKFGRRSREF